MTKNKPTVIIGPHNNDTRSHLTFADIAPHVSDETPLFVLMPNAERYAVSTVISDQDADGNARLVFAAGSVAVHATPRGYPEDVIIDETPKPSTVIGVVCTIREDGEKHVNQFYTRYSLHEGVNYFYIYDARSVRQFVRSYPNSLVLWTHKALNDKGSGRSKDIRSVLNSPREASETPEPEAEVAYTHIVIGMSQDQCSEYIQRTHPELTFRGNPPTGTVVHQVWWQEHMDSIVKHIGVDKPVKVYWTDSMRDRRVGAGPYYDNVRYMTRLVKKLNVINEQPDWTGYEKD